VVTSPERRGATGDETDEHVARWQRLEKPTFAHRLEYVGVRVAVGCLKRFPTGLAYRLGERMGVLAWRIGIRREVVLANLSAAVGLTGGEDPPRIAAACYRHVGRSFAELAVIPGLSADEVKALVTFEGLEHVRAAVDAGRGVIALSGHYGSPEVMTVGLAAHGMDPHVLVAPMRNPLVSDFFSRHREAYGVHPVEVGPSMRELIRVLRKGAMVCMAADQDAGRHGLFVDFLGRAASTATGPVELARRTGAAIVFGTVRRREDGTHVAVIDPPITIEDRGDDAATVRYYVEDLSRRLERAVREVPEQWFWLHRRWKTKPPSKDGAGAEPHA
jgi:KDO2-lipid IV(A) lauroyltransferase